MEAPVATTQSSAVPSGVVACPEIGRISGDRSRSVRRDIGSLWTPVLRSVGRAVVGLPPSTWLLVDLTLLTLGVYTGYCLFPPYQNVPTPHIALWQAAAVFAFAGIIASLVFGLYERETVMARSRILTRVMLACITAAIIAYAIIYVIMYATVSRRAAATALSVFFVSGTGIRWLAYSTIRRLHRGVLIVGPRALFDSFRRSQDQGLLNEYRLAGYVTVEDNPENTDDEHFKGNVFDQLPNLVEHRITDIVVGARAARDPRVMEWMVPCLQAGCRVTNEAIFYEKATGQILVEEITPSWFLFADLKVHCDEQATLKRITDLCTAVVGLLLSAPLWAVIAAAVKLCDGGPVFYWQDRVGQNGRVFRLYKFRTMRAGAESGKSVWCSPHDRRVTPVGRFLRRTRLDELPQLYNVLIGRMSIVGPRPERPDIVEELRAQLPYYSERHLVKPGVTGWAQINFRYGASVADAQRKLQFDLYYLKHMSFELDVIILFRTLGTFLKGAC